jgi:hypothetical protein
MNTHHGYKYGFIMICILGIIEILRIEKDSEKHGLIARLLGR